LSNARAIAAVTSTIRNMLFQAVSNDVDLAGTAVTTRPPDRARQAGATGNQINLFLYRTSIDAAWRNQDPPGIRPGESGQPALPLVLSYLMTAYGEDDEEVLAHRLLGIGMQVLNDQPLLSSDAIAAALPGSGLEDQPERVRITFSTGYRISASYDAAVVLIDNTQPVRASLPVLARSAADAGPQVGAQLTPNLERAIPPNGQSGARPGDVVVLAGRRLDAVSGIRVSGGAMSGPRLLPVVAASKSAVSIQLPADAPLPAGSMAVTAVVTPESGEVLTSNVIPLLLVPVIATTAPITATLAGGSASIEVPCAPPVAAGQSVALLVGDRIVGGTAATQARSTLPFVLAGFTAGEYVLRLRVDGADSIPVVPGHSEFDPNQRLVLS
jgi:hypothetical protein